MKHETLLAIEEERAYQDRKWSQEAAPLPPSDELRLIRVIASQADALWYTSPDRLVDGVKVNPSDMDAMRKIAAVAIRCMDRWGAVSRKL